MRIEIDLPAETGGGAFENVVSEAIVAQLRSLPEQPTDPAMLTEPVVVDEQGSVQAAAVVAQASIEIVEPRRDRTRERRVRRKQRLQGTQIPIAGELQRIDEDQRDKYDQSL